MASPISGRPVSTPKPILLMTRPPEDSARFVDMLAAEIRTRVDVIYAPLLKIVVRDEAIDLDSYSGVIFTSANAVGLLAKNAGKPAFCVGTQTTLRARQAGWDAVQCGENAEKFIENMTTRRPTGPLIHLSGKHQRGDIAQELTKSGITTDTKIIYDQMVKPLTSQAIDVLGGEAPVFVPLFSPRTAQQFALELSELPICVENQVVALALSQAVAEPLVQVAGIAEVIVAAHPTAREMSKALEKWLVGLSLP